MLKYHRRLDFSRPALRFVRNSKWLEILGSEQGLAFPHVFLIPRRDTSGGCGL
jgi:hypothetical protein